jgi:polyisoprenoid-binding protein YceI
MPRQLPLLILALLIALGSRPAAASEYLIDTKDAHAFIQFKISHLGFSWLLGCFDRFSGTFSYDEADPASASVEVVIDTASVNTNHAERDNHLREPDYLDAADYPQARFVSTGYEPLGGGKGRLHGNFTLRGVTHPIVIDVNAMGSGSDPWGGYRRGFEGTTHLTLADYGITVFLGAAAKEVEIYLSIEGVRQKSENRPNKPGGLHL